jgi:cyclopropane fatty-acyl-phospholipid synthase-like methyltransferase
VSQARDPRRYLPHVGRNRAPILAVLRRVLPSTGLVLEVASGSGEHAVYFASELPALTWQPSDRDPQARESIAAHRSAAGTSNLLAPVDLDAASPEWPVRRADALVCINMIHIAPWAAAEGLFAGARRILPVGGVVCLYGAYRVDGRHTAPSNEHFDDWLRSQDRAWGVRDLGAVTDLAARNGFVWSETVPMPANNVSVVFRRGAG